MKLNERFTDFADWVSAAMGTPLNIGLWLLAVAIWFAIFWSHPALANSSFLPAWFTGTTFNFPLNTVTTLAELYIGFLVAAAANRVERRNREQTAKMQALEERIDTLVEGMAKLLEADHVEHGRLLRDLHSHTVCTGHTVIASEEQNPPAAHTRRKTAEEKA